MPSAAEHGALVLSGILPANRARLEAATRKLTPEHFTDKIQSKLFAMLQLYLERAGGVMPGKFLTDQLRSIDAGQALLYAETYEAYTEDSVEESEFLWSVEQLRELAAETATGEAITEAMAVLTKGVQDESGETIRGHEAARARIMESFTVIDRDLTMQDAPEGDLRNEAKQMLDDYAERKRIQQQGLARGILFGIPELDAKLGGMQRGELVLAAGYSSDGKSTLCVQAAWHAAVEQGKNVVFLTTETLRPQIIRKIQARHSMKADIIAETHLPQGLNSKNIKGGTLSPEEENALRLIVTDLTKNPAYGHIYIAQVPRQASISSIEQRLIRYQREFDIDLVVMDYLALLVSTQRRQTTREELASIMRESKQVATTFNNGMGVPFLSPWQVSRDAREQAEKDGLYTSRALSETAEATNSADIIVSLLAPTENTDRRAEVAMQVLKHRDGETANDILVNVDYATSTFTSRASAVALRAAPGVSGGEGLGASFGLDDI